MSSTRVRATASSRGKQRLVPWVLVALLLHLEIAGGLVALVYFFAPRNAELVSVPGLSGDDSVDIEMMDPDAARKILAELEREDEKRRQEEARKEEESARPPGQVVELARPRNQERPENARFAAEFDSKVERETRKLGELDRDAVQGRSDGPNPVTTPPQPMAQPAPSAAPLPPSRPAARILAMRTPAPIHTMPGGGLQDTSVANAESEPGLPPGPGQQSFALPPIPPAQSKASESLGSGPEGGRHEFLLPSPEQVARAIGSGTIDHLADVEEGEETALNAKKWKFASFFNRVKQQVRENWRPAEEYRKRDPTFRIYGQKDRYTLLRVQLRPDGTLANVVLETPSGVEFLDDEAIEAFKQAQPFPNPPAGLVQDGAISFRFGFFFEIGGGSVPRMKYFRYNDF